MLPARNSPCDAARHDGDGFTGGEKGILTRQIDFSPQTNDKQLTSTAKKASKTSGRARESKTWGTRKAAEIRTQCNKLTHAEREALWERATQLAYGN